MEYVIGGGYLGPIAPLIEKHELQEFEELEDLLEEAGFDFFELENDEIFITYEGRHILLPMKEDSFELPDDLACTEEELRELEEYTGPVSKKIKVGKVASESNWMDDLAGALLGAGKSML